MEKEQYAPKPPGFYRESDAIELADHLDELIRKLERGKLEIFKEHHRLFEATLLNHQYPEPRRKAAALLGMIGTAGSIKQLKRASDLERDSVVKMAIETALARLGKKR